MKAKRKVEQWRQDQGLSYQALANLLGCTRQYARTLCTQGSAGVILAVKLMKLSQGAIELTDLLSREDRKTLTEQGFLEPAAPDEPDNVI